MSSVSFLFDENVSPAIVKFLKQTEPQVQVYSIGDGVAPPKGTLDPEILNWIEKNGCLLVTNNRSSMPIHLQDHINQGRHVLGIIQLPHTMNVPLIVENLVTIWAASLPDDFFDQIVYIPL